MIVKDGRSGLHAHENKKSRLCLKSGTRSLRLLNSRPAGLLLFFGKVQLTSAGGFLPKYQKGRYQQWQQQHGIF
jgi:hypothetical protein